MPEATTIAAKYIYLDIVDFTKGRTVEAQTDILENLNSVIKTSVCALNVPSERRIFIPTGDGVCIALLGIEETFDVHMLIALHILKEIYEHNQETADPQRSFSVRIGINSNIDNLVTDINGNRNVAGDGINTSQRIMSLADAGQILVSEAVFDVLHFRNAYFGSFRQFMATVKHGRSVVVYQYLALGKKGVNLQTPRAFEVPDSWLARVLYAIDKLFGSNVERESWSTKVATALANGNIGAAHEIVDQCKAKRRGFRIFHPVQLNHLGYELLREGSLEDAIEIFKLNLKLYPRLSDLHDSLAEAYARKGDFDEAIKSYQNALRLNSNNVNASEALAKLLARRSRDEAGSVSEIDQTKSGSAGV